MEVPKSQTPDDYRNFMRSEQGANIRPGSQEEKLVMDGFRKSRGAQAEKVSGTSEEEPGAIADELRVAEDSSLGVVRGRDSEIAHQQARIKVEGPGPDQPAEKIRVSHDTAPAGVGAEPENRETVH